MIYHYAHDFTRFARENKSPRTIIYGRLAAARAPRARGGRRGRAGAAPAR